MGVVLAPTSRRLRRRPLRLRGLRGGSCLLHFLEPAPVVGRAVAVAGRSDAHLALGAPPAKVFRGRIRSHLPMSHFQPLRVASLALLFLLAGLNTGTARA